MYIEQPQGFEVHGKESHVCRLNETLYDLKQAPRGWHSRIDTYLQEMGFTKSDADPNLYFIVIGEEPLILVLYVDDLVITGTERLIELQERSCFGVRDEGHWIDALLFGFGGVAGGGAFLPGTGEVYCGHY